MLNYTVFTDEIGDKLVKYSIDGKEYITCIETTRDGYEYYNVPNMIHPVDINGCQQDDPDYMFINRIKDAVDTIKKGDADVLITDYIFGCRCGYTSSIKFVDENYGNEMRQKFITGLKDAKFCYAVRGGWTHSFSGYNYIREDDTEGIFYSKAKIKTFDTMDDALAYINSMTGKATSLASDYEISNDADKNKILKSLLCNEWSSVLCKLFRSKAGLLSSTKDNIGEYRLEVSQYMILPELAEDIFAYLN